MGRKSTLNEVQKKRASDLTKKLKLSVKRADYRLAKECYRDLNSLLSPHLETTRLMKARNWVFEAAMEAEKWTEAEKGLKIVLTNLGRRTRGRLETMSVLSILYIRTDRFEEAKEFIFKVIQNESVIRSQSERKKFHEHFIDRIEQELLVVSLRGDVATPLNIQDVETKASTLIQQRHSQEDLETMIGKALPDRVKVLLLKVDKEIRKSLPYETPLALTQVSYEGANLFFGGKFFKAFRRRAYKVICDPKRKTQKTYSKVGLCGLFGGGLVLSKAVCGVLDSIQAGSMDVAAPMLATFTCLKLDQFCLTTENETILLK